MHWLDTDCKDYKVLLLIIDIQHIVWCRNVDDTEIIRRLVNVMYWVSDFRIVCKTDSLRYNLIEVSTGLPTKNVTIRVGNMIENGKCIDYYIIASSNKDDIIIKMAIEKNRGLGIDIIGNAVNTVEKIVDLVTEHEEDISMIGVRLIKYPDMPFEIDVIGKSIKLADVIYSKYPYTSVYYNEYFDAVFIRRLMELVYKLIVEDLLYVFMYPQIYSV